CIVRFFFQAEDGIRDWSVTGVQTCALPIFAARLAAITDRFNALAQALEAARAENEQLNHRLITAQDDERRRTALDLHDEVGPNRSEERRVGKEGRCRRRPCEQKRKTTRRTP